MVDAKEGGLFVSEDAGLTFRRACSDRRIWQRGWYWAGINVDPKDPNVVYALNTAMYRSTDSGKTFLPFKGAPGGDDYHRLWIDPADARRMIVASDQGAVVTVDGGKTWSSWYNQPTAQFFHAITDERFPYWIYGAQQDTGAAATPSRTDYRSITRRDWKEIAAGGENGYIAPDPNEPRPPLRRRGRPLRPEDAPGAERRPDARLPGHLPERVDAPRRRLAPQPESRLVRQPVRLPDAGRRPPLGEGQPRPDARGPRRPTESRSDHRRDERHERPAPRRRLRPRPLARRRRPDLGRHRRRARLALAGRCPDLDERDAEGSRPVVEGRYPRALALRRGDRLRRRRPAPDRRHRSRTSTGRGTAGRAGRSSRRGSRPVATSTSSGKTRRGRGSSTPAPRLASSSPSTTETIGSRCSSISPTARSATSTRSTATSSSGRMAARSGCWTTSRRSASSTRTSPRRTPSSSRRARRSGSTPRRSSAPPNRRTSRWARTRPAAPSSTTSSRPPRRAR